MMTVDAPHADPGQEQVVAFMADPATHGGPVETISTHGAHVFLSGDRAWKLKRAVRYPYLDFSTLELRERLSRAEVAINRRTAPTLYLGAHAIRRRPDGRLGFDGEGEAVDWVVEMRRFPQEALFDRIAERGALDEPLIDDLADVTAAFHAGAERAPAGWSDRMGWIVEDNVAGLRAAGFLDEGRIGRLAASGAAWLDRTEALRAARLEGGFVRRCHGDLHLRNVCLVDGRATPFDAIEFSDDIAICDVLYDLAFLLMDLEKRGLRRLANRTLNRWLDRTGDDDALALLPLFLSQRASVRAKVVAAGADAAPEGEQAGRRAEAAAYLDLALAYLDPPPARLVAVGGWSGTGKTTLARALAPDIGPAPGAIVIRSDVIRKTLAGVGETERLPAAAYTKDASAAVYTALEARAARVLAAGHGAIADAVFGMEEERSAIEAVARHAATRFDGLWLEVPLAVATARVAARRGDASDADAAVVERQHKNETGPIAWPTVDASGSAETVAARASAMLMPA